MNRHFFSKLPAGFAFSSLRHQHFGPQLLLACLSISLLSGCAEITQSGLTNPAQASSGLPIYAAGDIADCRRSRPQDSGAAETAALVEGELARNERSMVLVLGDSTYPDGHAKEFAHCYQPTWGRFKDRTHPAPGNHEYHTEGAAGYYDYFGAAAGKRERGYYSMEAGGWHIIALNSNLKGEEFSAQLVWLQSELAQRRTHCTLAFWHHPVFSSGGHGNNDRMLPAWRVLADANVELALTGHDHHYERFAPMDGLGELNPARGMRQFIVGTGGARLTPVLPFGRNSEARGNSSNGVLKLVLMPGAYTWEFLPTDPAAHADRGSGTCH